MLLALFVLFIPNQADGAATQQYYFDPGLRSYEIKFPLETDIEKTKVLHDFTNVVGTNTAELTDLEDQGVYSLLVENRNGSYIADLWLYNVVPTWLCPFTYEEYFLIPIPTSYYPGRTAVVGCTILGAEQPTIKWQKYIPEIETWRNISDLGFFDEGNNTRYFTTGLGHLYITDFNEDDQGLYRCLASNSCGRRCPNETACSGEPVLTNPVNLTLSTNNSDNESGYFLNTVINNCWDTDGNNYKGVSDSHACSGTRPSNGHISAFNQYTSLNSTPYLEGFFDFARPSGNSSVDIQLVGTVNWMDKTTNSFSNFGTFKAPPETSGLCLGRILGFAKENMQEYYYCTGFEAVSGLLLRSMRFEFILKEAPFVTLPRGVAGANMARIVTVAYGEDVKIEFRIAVRIASFEKNKVKDRWMCLFNGVQIKDSWHKRCNFNASRSEIVQFNIDYAVMGDGGYYQVIARNDEGWAIGPSILLVVNGTEPESGKYVLRTMGTTEYSITVGWNRPNAQSAVFRNYTIRIENRDWEENIRSINEPSEWLDIKGLNPGALYAITVTLNGGLVADTKTIRTKPIKTTALVDFYCSAEPTSIDCEWDYPNASTWHSESLSYKAVYWEAMRERKSKAKKEIRGLSVTLEGLKPHTAYIVEITACNVMGCSDVHEMKMFTTAEQLPGLVQFVRDPWPVGTSIWVELDYPEPLPGELQTEVVRYEEKDYNKLMQEGVVDPDVANSSHLFKPSNEDPRFEIAELHPNTVYYIKLRWKTGAGEGNFTPFYRVPIPRYVDWKPIIIFCGVSAFITISMSIFTIYVRRRWPGFFKYLLEKLREFFEGSIYLTPRETVDFPQEDDPNITYDFDGPGVVFCIQK